MEQRYLDLYNNLKNEGEQHLNSRLLIVDGLNTYIRSHVINPVTNNIGYHVGGITGFLMSVGAAIKQVKPTRVILVFDGKGGSQRRKNIYSDYKRRSSNNTPLLRNVESILLGEDPDVSMRRQMSLLSNLLTTLPVSVIVVDHIEADDSIAYLIQTQIQPFEDRKAFIMSSDRDYLQLVSNRISVWSPTKKIMYTKETVLTEYKVDSSNFILYKCMIGDKSDNVPKVPGIGPAYIRERFPELSLDKPVELDTFMKRCKEIALENTNNLKIHSLLMYEDRIRLNYKLMQLQDVDISGNAKMQILDRFENDIRPFNKTEFLQLINSSGMSESIKNLVYWMNEVFARLDIMNRDYLSTKAL